MLKKLRLNKPIIIFFLLLLIFSCDSRKKLEIRKNNLIKEANRRCPLVRGKEYKKWSFHTNDDFFPVIVKTEKKSEEVLMLDTKSYSHISGYYIVETDSSFIEISIYSCDTTIFYKINTIDTIFFVGYYKYLYDNRLLSNSQRRFFSENRDSLMKIRGNNLRPLDTLPEFEISEEDYSIYSPIDNDGS